MKQSHKTIILWAMIILLAMSAFYLVKDPRANMDELKYNDFIEKVTKQHQARQQGQEISPKIVKVTVDGADITGQWDNKKKFQTVGPVNDKYLDLLVESGAQVTFEKPDEAGLFTQIILTWLPLIVLIGFFVFFMRQVQSGGGRAMSFGKSKAKLLNSSNKKVTFADVAGVDEAKQEVQEIVEFLKDPKRFTSLGGRIPKGVLLMGSPGTGKTLLARAIAGEAGVPFFSISGSEFVEMFVGVGASRVRDLFEQGKENAPCLVFIDEIDAVGRHRGAGLGGGHDEREQTLNQLLVEMDGFESKEGVILIAATNRPDVLDPALLRPGRFDRRVVVGAPDVKGREGILKVHTRKIPMNADVDLPVVARGTPGFSGADLEILVNEAALQAARRGKKSVHMVDFEFAKDKVMLGTPRRSMIISDAEKKNTAYHESGHALVARLIPGADPVHKVTIIPHGMALGLTQQLPEEDKYTMNKSNLLTRIRVLLGGRAAERVIFNDTTTGAGNDIQRATELARRMVCEWGMSERLGPVSLGKREEHIFLGREISRQQDYSAQTAVAIDEEIRKIIDDAEKETVQILTDNIDALHRMAEALLERETIDAVDIEAIMTGEPLPGKVDGEAEEADDVPINTIDADDERDDETPEETA